MLLIVDGDPRCLEDAATLFGPNDVWFASSVEQARSLMAAVGSSLSVALVDLDMPGNDGFRFIGELRKFCPGLPVIAMSAITQAVVFDAAKLAGAVEALRKPITSEWRGTIDRVRADRSA